MIIMQRALAVTGRLLVYGYADGTYKIVENSLGSNTRYRLPQAERESARQIAELVNENHLLETDLGMATETLERVIGRGENPYAHAKHNAAADMTYIARTGLAELGAWKRKPPAALPPKEVQHG